MWSELVHQSNLSFFLFGKRTYHQWPRFCRLRIFLKNLYFDFRERHWFVVSLIYIFIGGFFIFLKILFIYFLQRQQGREKEKERNIDVWKVHRPAASLMAPISQACVWDQELNALVHRPVLNPLCHNSQGSLVDSYIRFDQGLIPQPWHTGMML